MRIDLEYFKKLFDIFLEADTALISISDLEKHGINVRCDEHGLDQRFIFTLNLCIDNQLIGSERGLILNQEDAGIILFLGGKYGIKKIPLRLTQKGHDFACALESSEVLDKLKSEFKNAPFKVLFEVGQQLLIKYAEKKLGQLEI